MKSASISKFDHVRSIVLSAEVQINRIQIPLSSGHMSSAERVHVEHVVVKGLEKKYLSKKRSNF